MGEYYDFTSSLSKFIYWYLVVLVPEEEMAVEVLFAVTLYQMVHVLYANVVIKEYKFTLGFIFQRFI